MSVDQPFGEVELEPGGAEADEVHAVAELGRARHMPGIVAAEQDGAIAAIEVDIAAAVLGHQLGAGDPVEDERAGETARGAGAATRQQATERLKRGLVRCRRATRLHASPIPIPSSIAFDPADRKRYLRDTRALPGSKRLPGLWLDRQDQLLRLEPALGEAPHQKVGGACAELEGRRADRRQRRLDRTGDRQAVEAADPHVRRHVPADPFQGTDRLGGELVVAGENRLGHMRCELPVESAETACMSDSATFRTVSPARSASPSRRPASLASMAGQASSGTTARTSRGHGQGCARRASVRPPGRPGARRRHRPDRCQRLLEDQERQAELAEPLDQCQPLALGTGHEERDGIGILGPHQKCLERCPAVQPLHEEAVILLRERVGEAGHDIGGERVGEELRRAVDGDERDPVMPAGAQRAGGPVRGSSRDCRPPPRPVPGWPPTCRDNGR